MKLQDLENGMIVTTREGRQYRVARNTIIDGFEYDLLLEVDGTGSLFFEDYDEDLHMLFQPMIPDCYHDFDIIKVDPAPSLVVK